MKASISGLVKSAKSSLSGKWGTAIGVIFAEAGIMYGITMGVVMIAYIVLIAIFVFVGIFTNGSFANDPNSYIILISLIVIPIIYGLMLGIYVFMHPLSIGKSKWFYKVVLGEESAFNTLFSYMKKGVGYLRGVKLFLWKILFTLLYSFIFIIPYSLFICFLMFFREFSIPQDNNLFYYLTLFCIGLLTFICFIFYFVIIQRYSLANYIFIENRELTAKQCIDKSVSLMKGRCFTPVLIILSIYWPLIIPFIATALLFVISIFVPVIMIFAMLLYFLSFLCLLGSMFYFYPLYETTMAKFAVFVFHQNSAKDNSIQAENITE